MKELSPRQAKTFDDVCKLNTDNHSLKDYWICLTGNNKINITKQRVGASSTESISIDRKSFNHLIDWYLKPQKLKGK
jgi:hypothetical protein